MAKISKKIKKSSITKEMAKAKSNLKFDKAIERIITSSIEEEQPKEEEADEPADDLKLQPNYDILQSPGLTYSDYDNAALAAIEEQDDVQVLKDIFKKNPLLDDTDPSKAQPLQTVKQEMLALLSDPEWLKGLAERYCMTTLDLMKVLYNHYEFMQNKFYLNKLSRSLKQAHNARKPQASERKPRAPKL